MNFSIESEGWFQVMAIERHTIWTWFCRRGFLVAVALTASLLAGCSANTEEQKSEEKAEEQKAEPEISLKPTTRGNFNAQTDGSAIPVTNLLTGFSQRVFEAQLGLIRKGISPGSMDGLLGSQTKAAIRAFQEEEDLPVTGTANNATLGRLTSDVPSTVTYTVSAEDLARLRPLGKTWLEKSQQDRMDYETILELVAEKSQAHPHLIRKLNPGIEWDHVAPGTSVYVPNAEFPKPGKAAFVRIALADRVLEVFDENTNMLAHFPCSIAQRVEKRPVGELHVEVIAPNPNYTFDPDVFPESAEARELDRKLILQPGPNNPVGVVWIGLDKPGYGIHGTPRPEDVGRTESHGCFRLANWNAEYLLRLITIGTTVVVDP